MGLSHGEAARLWNTIPNNLRNIYSYRSFKRGLKELVLSVLIFRAWATCGTVGNFPGAFYSVRTYSVSVCCPFIRYVFSKLR